MHAEVEKPMPSEDTYHHGDLPAALLAAVDELIREGGVGAVSLRAAARLAGVTHSAPAHHFGDKAGMLTAFATHGFRMLGDHLAGVVPPAGSPADAFDFIDVGKAYVDFAVTHPSHFAVMFRPEHLHPEDDDYLRAAIDSFMVVVNAVRILRDDLPADDPRILQTATGAWSMAHGFATLWLDGNMSLLVETDDAVAAASRAFRAFTESSSRAG